MHKTNKRVYAHNNRKETIFENQGRKTVYRHAQINADARPSNTPKLLRTWYFLRIKSILCSCAGSYLFSSSSTTVRTAWRPGSCGGGWRGGEGRGVMVRGVCDEMLIRNANQCHRHPNVQHSNHSLTWLYFFLSRESVARSYTMGALGTCLSFFL